ncbi:MAG: VCBS repeat-containing protein [Planctomycetes bacterium]|nr:VCBS repeat-containing protein [Planctomycetota bacterium]
MRTAIAYSVLALSWFASAAFGQALNLFPSVPSAKSWPMEAGSGSATLAITGRIGGSGHADVVQVIGGVPYLFDTPGLQATFTRLPGAWSGVTGLCVRDGGPSPTRQQVLISDDVGLRLCVYDASLGLLAVPLPLPGVDGVSRMSAADVDGDGHQDLLCVHRDGRTIQLLHGAPGGFGEMESCTLAAMIDGLVSVPWPGGANARAIAVVSGGSLRLYAGGLAGASQVLATSPAPFTSTLLVVRTSPSTSALVWCSGSDSSNVLHFVGPSGASSITFGGHDLVAGAAGDVDGDGDDDVVFSQRGSHRALLLMQRTTGFAYTLLDAAEIELTTPNSTPPAPANLATPVLADLDCDGDADLVHAVQSQAGVARAMSPFLAPGNGRPVLAGGRFLEQPSLSLQLQLEAGWTPPPGTTHFEVIRWRMRREGSSYVVDPSHVPVRERFPANTTELTLGIGGLELVDLGEVYRVWIRAVVVANDLVQMAFPPEVGVLSGNNVVHPELMAAFPNREFEIPFEHSEDGGEIGGGYIGIGVPPPPTGGGPIPGGG